MGSTDWPGRDGGTESPSRIVDLVKSRKGKVEEVCHFSLQVLLQDLTFEIFVRCFSRLQINYHYKPPPSRNRKGIAKYSYQLIRNDAPTQPSSFSLTPDSSPCQTSSFLESFIRVGDPIVVSMEPNGPYALAVGFVEGLTKNTVTLGVDRQLGQIPRKSQNFDEQSNQELLLPSQGEDSQRELVYYRVDLDEFSSGQSLQRDNLVQLFIGLGSEKLRGLIVDLNTPLFSPLSPLKVSIGKGGELKKVMDKLNPDQSLALQRVLTARDYALILGMPGTGKTHLISLMIKSLVEQGKSVLITAYTHLAVDHILMKLESLGVDFVRLGNPSRVRAVFSDFLIISC
jgi:DNA replication ATP-dependent helicase Dna2